MSIQFKRFTIGLLSLTATFFLFLSNVQAENLLRAGTYTVSASKKWVVLGISAPSVDPNTRANAEAQTESADSTGKVKDTYNLASMGFAGREIDSILPKFLIEIEDDVVQSVRSFEVDRFEKNEILLDIPNEKKKEQKHFAHQALKGTLKTLGFPFSTAAILANLPRHLREEEKQLQAYYLLELVNQALPPYHLFPDLSAAISDDPLTSQEQLRKIGQAILTRFNPVSTRAGLKVPEGGGEFFEVWRRTQIGLRSQNKAYILRLANERKLRVASMGDFFGIIFLEATQNTTPEEIQKHFDHLKFVGLGLDKKDSAKIAETAIQYSSKKGALIPWHLIAFSHEKGPVDLANFISPRTFVSKLRRQADAELAGEIGGSILPFESLLAKAVKLSLAKKNQFQGRTHYLRRTPSYGSILALTETRAYDLQFSGAPLNSNEIVYEQLTQAISKMGIEWNGDLLNEEKDLSPSEVLNQASALILRAERDGAKLSAKQNGNKTEAFRNNSLAQAKRTQIIRESNISALVQVLQNKTRRGGRGPASLPQAQPQAKTQKQPARSNERKPVILFLVDGLRPDRFRIAAEQGLMPNLSALFYKKGVDLESVASRSLTLPSWATMFTGFEPDYHGLKSNTPGSRVEQKITENFTDARKDLFHIKNWVKNRAFQRIEENKTGEEDKIWFPGYYDRKQVLFNHMPIVNGPTRSITRLILDYLDHQPEYINKIRFQATALDLASAESTAAKITKDARGKKNLRLVMNWYAGVDEASHYNNSILPFVYAEIDRAVGMLLGAARSHPILKDATVFLISDHGHTGGYGPFSLQTALSVDATQQDWNETNPPLMRNTGFNVTKFLVGQNYDYPHYQFVVGSALPPEPKYEFSTRSFLFSPYAFTYPMQFHRPTALVDCSGDNIAQLYFKGDQNWRRLTLAELTQIPGGKEGNEQKLDIIKDLLEVKLPNLMVNNTVLARKITELSDNHPVALLAIPLQGQAARLSADQLGLRTGPSTREPVLLLTRAAHSDEQVRDPRLPPRFKTGLILTRSDEKGHDQFRYVVVKNFQQDLEGKITGIPSNDAEDDPLGYLGKVEGAHQFHQWRSDREWLTRAHHHRWPSAIFTLARQLTLAPKFTNPDSKQVAEKIKEARQAEIPDLILVANPGYSFHSDEPMESDHGGLAQEEILNSFFISSLEKDTFSRHLRISEFPVLTRDVMPTVLSFAGLGSPGFDPLPQTQGKNLMPWLSDLSQGRSVDEGPQD